MSLLRFTGKVAIVTGAGGGLGREYALELARRGASVVVNDLGGTRSGEGANSSAADKVVQEIKTKGGEAVADYNSVEDGEKVVETAIKNYGRIDILINNAGILRDKSFTKMSVSDWDLIHRVHLRGSFMVSRAAWPYFRKQNFGRIIMTSSGAGVYGNFGQANYSAAKLGLIGLSNTLAIEGEKYNIHSNVIIPIAASRLTQDVLPPQVFDQLKPEYVSPVVVWLCHESCNDNGGMFEAAGGWVGKYQWQRSLGKAFIPASDLTPENVKAEWQKVTDMVNSNSPGSLQEQTGLLIEALSGEEASDVDQASIFNYTADSIILYALAVGVSTEQIDHLKFVYENAEDLCVIPTFGTIPSLMALMNSTELQDQMQKLNADPTKLLHGEQFIELYKPLAVEDSLHSTCKVVDILDKGSGAVAIVDVITYNKLGEKVMFNQFATFFVGSGNFGGKRNSLELKPIAAIPSRSPDSVIEEKTSVDQAALYRLCGDKNPLHIDPSFAAMGGFSKPILHGLCSLGFATRHVLKQFANNDVKKFKSLKIRFSGPIFPGETIRTEMWVEGNKVFFQSLNATQNKPILSGGYVELTDVVLTREATPQRSLESDVKSDAVFAELARRLKEMPDITSKIQAIYQWNITKDGKTITQWTTDLKAGNIYKGSSKEKPGVTLSLDDDDMISLMSGKLDPQRAFMTGRLKIKGNIMLTQKLRGLLTQRAAGSSSLLKSKAIFNEMAKSIKQYPDLVKTVGHCYLYNITKGGQREAQFTVDLKKSGEVYEGEPKNQRPDCTLTMEDDSFMALYSGNLNPQKAFMTGALKVSGNILAAQKLQDLFSKMPKNEPAKTDVRPNEPSRFKSDHIFQAFSERVPEEPELAKKVKVLFYWNILKEGKKVTDWTVDLKTGAGNIYHGPPKDVKADVVLTIDDEDLVRLMMGKLNPQRAFMTGRLKIKGNIMLTQKLNQLWQEILKSGRAVELPFFAPILTDKSFDPDLRSEPYLLEMAKKLARTPNLKGRIQSIYELDILKNGTLKSQITLDLKSDQPTIRRGTIKGVTPDCLLKIEDDDVVDLVLGNIAPNKVLNHPRIKITGNPDTCIQLLELIAPKAKL